jgi:hypothetical protein
MSISSKFEPREDGRRQKRQKNIRKDGRRPRKIREGKAR